MKSGYAIGLFSLFLAVLVPGWAAADSESPANQINAWQVEKYDDHGTARMAAMTGMARYNSKTGEALLQIACTVDSRMKPHASLMLAIQAQRLGFNPNDYEGPAATAHGPLRLITGERPAVIDQVTGWIPGERLPKKEWDFMFGATANLKELSYWLTRPARSNRISLTLPSTLENDGPLTAVFVLPEDDRGLRGVIAPCLKASRTIGD